MHIIAINAIYLLLGNKYTIFSFAHADKRKTEQFGLPPELPSLFTLWGPGLIIYNGQIIKIGIVNGLPYLMSDGVNKFE
ncbi:hypothetical protein [Caproicibacter sp. BJN0012]|uniref:hypothetical protein n=1 Tax=Caproicibacter sp. BJN0012 TaxID=3110227 RepID=UPI002E137B65